ncbi:MAG TPA: hypothetical protein PLV92_23265, partial [Pirellulaceae bacterium]|nr:hypothetical protein [Pirellulaceae bacterium]
VADAAEAAAARQRLGLPADAKFTSISDVTIVAGGSITGGATTDAEVDLVGDEVTLRAGDEISSFELAVNRIVEASSNTGSIVLHDQEGFDEQSPGLTLVQASAPAGAITISSDATFLVGAVKAGGVGAAGGVTLTATNGAIALTNIDGVVAAVSSGANLQIFAGSDLTLNGTISSTGDIALTSDANVLTSDAQFQVSAGGSLGVEAIDSVQLRGTWTSGGALSATALAGDLSSDALLRATAGKTLASVALSAWGNYVAAGPAAGKYEFRSTLNGETYYLAAPQLPLAIPTSASAWQITSGVLTAVTVNPRDLALLPVLQATPSPLIDSLFGLPVYQATDGATYFAKPAENRFYQTKSPTGPSRSPERP